ncbi:MAG: serine hydrolase [Coxiellaceae bacterium]|nr:serine hydrolase [Coxiellaceae bacterium]
MKQLVIISALISLCSTAIATPPVHTKDHDVKAIMQHYMHKYVKKERFSALQLSYRYHNPVIHNLNVGKVAYGGGAKLLTSANIIGWGSLTKAVTAAIILDLRATPESPIKLSQTLAHWFPKKFFHKKGMLSEWPQAWRTVTIADLLHMTSGIPPYINTGLDTLTKKQLARKMKPQQLVAIAAQLQRNKNHYCKSKHACFKAGSRFYYSNTNYIIAGMIASKAASQISGKSISFSYLMQHFLNRYTNKETIAIYYPDLTKNIPNNLVRSYRNSPVPRVFFRGEDVTQYNLTWLGAAGGIVGNTQGMVTVISAIAQLPKAVNPFEQANSYVSMNPNKPLHIANRHQQCTSTKKTPCYGFGITYINANKRHQAGEAYFYEGEGWGSRALYYWLPQRDITVAVAANSAVTPANDHLYQIFSQLFASVFN